MKILVFSDAHGNTANMAAAIEAQGDADVLFFLGDGLRDAETVFARYPECAHAAVAGNCDPPQGRALEDTLLEIGGLRFFLCHGHRLGVRSGLDTAAAVARARGADILLYGHTHVPEIRYLPGDLGERPLTVLNPGSVREGSYGMIMIAHNSPLFSLVTV